MSRILVRTVYGPREVEFEPAGDFREYRRRWAAWDDRGTLFSDVERSVDRRISRAEERDNVIPGRRAFDPETNCFLAAPSLPRPRQTRELVDNAVPEPSAEFRTRLQER